MDCKLPGGALTVLSIDCSYYVHLGLPMVLVTLLPHAGGLDLPLKGFGVSLETATSKPFRKKKLELHWATLFTS